MYFYKAQNKYVEGENGYKSNYLHTSRHRHCTIHTVHWQIFKLFNVTHIKIGTVHLTASYCLLCIRDNFLPYVSVKRENFQVIHILKFRGTGTGICVYTNKLSFS